MSEKKRRKDSKLWMLDARIQSELYAICSGPGSYAAGREWLKSTHGVNVSSEATFSKWWACYPFSLPAATDFATTFEKELSKLPEMEGQAEKISRLGQVGFEVMAMRTQDPKLFAMASKGRFSKAKLQLEREKFEHAKKEAWEHGLEALHAEIKGNAEALKHFEAMKSALRKSA